MPGPVTYTNDRKNPIFREWKFRLNDSVLQLTTARGTHLYDVPLASWNDDDSNDVAFEIHVKNFRFEPDLPLVDDD